MKTLRLLMVACFAAAVVTGCEEAPPPAPPAPPAKKADKPAEVAQTAASTGVQYVYSYNPVGKRDPFRSPVPERQADLGGPGQTCNEPLCAFDLDQLTLVAVVTGDANPVAMVEDPQGRGFIVRRNTRMGKQGGKVTNILRDSVTVTEYYTSADGRVNSNPVSMKLKPDALTPPSMDLATGKMIP